MSEVTIKINKTTLFVVGGLLVGLAIGYVWGGLGNGPSLIAKNPGNNVIQNQPSGNTDSLTEPTPGITVSADDHIRGAKNPKVLLVEYSDFQCPYCQRFHPTMVQILANYPNDVATVYRHFPLSFHQNAQISAEASECAGEQNKFWELSDLMFEKGQSDGTGLNKADLKQYAKDLGLNTSKFNDCLDTNKMKDKVAKDYSSGTAAGISGTPGTIMIAPDGTQRLISGAVPYDQIKSLIDSVL